MNLISELQRYLNNKEILVLITEIAILILSGLYSDFSKITRNDQC